VHPIHAWVVRGGASGDTGRRLENMIRNRFNINWARSLDEVLAQLEAWRIPLRGRPTHHGGP
jgi:hypothetical protein